MYNGTIEGFFGRQWSHADRISHCNFLKNADYNFYIYAPKSDKKLRALWFQDWIDSEWLKLISLSNHCKNINLDFGIGFTPFELHLNFDKRSRKLLDHKIQRINQLNPDILCILFDDMRGDVENLAHTQSEITDYIRDNSNANRLIVCPSYYSEDPILDKVFGIRPANYTESLGQRLHKDIEIFWTGSKVCSNSFNNHEIQDISKKLRRKPFIWDNYPVNDGKNMCNHLHIKGFSNRSSFNETNIAGHAINPMNQAWLSQIPLNTLPEMYESDKNLLSITGEAIDSLTPPDIAKALKADTHLFHHQGLTNISPTEKAHLIEKYQKLTNSNYSKEIIDWLQGDYEFDPNCLTN